MACDGFRCWKMQTDKAIIYSCKIISIKMTFAKNTTILQHLENNIDKYINYICLQLHIVCRKKIM